MARGDNVDIIQDELTQATESGRFLSEYNNGLIIYKPYSRWKVVGNRAGLRVVGNRIG